jgi:uncharacterized membrane protein YczE
MMNWLKNNYRKIGDVFFYGGVLIVGLIASLTGDRTQALIGLTMILIVNVFLDLRNMLTKRMTINLTVENDVAGMAQALAEIISKKSKKE